MQKTGPQKPPKLYNCIVRCHVCLKELGRLRDTEMKTGLIISYKNCQDHPKAYVMHEWEPKE